MVRHDVKRNNIRLSPLGYGHICARYAICRVLLMLNVLCDSCKISFWDGSSLSPSPPTRSSWSTRLCIVTALRQSSSITSGIHTLLNISPCHTPCNTPCVHGRCSFCGLACVHFFAGPKNRAYPGALICHAALFGFSSGTVHCPRHHSAGNTHHSCLIQALRLHS